ncbi:hypothetical protein NEOKW01_0977 [Nematocida sp. AWRm80]|nr:hypothetical protein NEOKW01_0977 [Nematocida sp. AWRm80]
MAFSFEDELEYFGFLPSDFHLELYEGLSKILEGCIDNNRSNIDKVESILKRSMVIFEGFTIRNMFTFSDDFVYDRKYTHKRVPAPEEIKEAMLSLSFKQETLNSLKVSVQSKQSTLSDLKDKLTEISTLQDIPEIISHLSELNRLIRETKEIKKEYVLGMPQNKPLKKDLEEKVRKNECIDLEKRMPLEILATLDRTISEYKENNKHQVQ